jgi:plastocyanin
MTDGGRGPRQSALLPVLIPVCALALIGAVLLGFSRILLHVTATGATVVAFTAAFGIMAVAAFVTTRKETGGTSVLALFGGVAGIAMLAGGGALLLAQPEAEVEPVVIALAIPENAAVDGFAKQGLTAPAGAPITIDLTSEDTVTHNIDIAESQDATPIVSSADITGPGATLEVPVEPLEAGSYAFWCKYHPSTMQGTLTVEEGAPEPPSGGPGGVTVVASNFAFDTTEIDLPPALSSITFDNKDPGATHNIAIFTDESASTSLFDGPDVLGPGTATYDVPALDPGTYYFHCDTHPTMNGSVVVSGAVGGGEGGGGGPPPSGSASPSPAGG